MNMFKRSVENDDISGEKISSKVFVAHKKQYEKDRLIRRGLKRLAFNLDKMNLNDELISLEKNIKKVSDDVQDVMKDIQKQK